MDALWDTLQQYVTVLSLARKIGHVNNIPTMQFFIGISRNTQSKSQYTLSMTECVWDFQNDALCDTCLIVLVNNKLA